MTGEEIRQLARKYHKPTDRVNERWHPVYQDECRMINRKEIEKSLMNKYNVSGKVNRKAQGSTLFAGMGKT